MNHFFPGIGLMILPLLHAQRNNMKASCNLMHSLSELNNFIDYVEISSSNSGITLKYMQKAALYFIALLTHLFCWNDEIFDPSH